MIDVIRFTPHEVRVRDDALNLRSTVEGFDRNDFIAGQVRQGIAVFDLKFEKMRLVRALAVKAPDGAWMLRLIEGNLPRLVHGHNAVPLVSHYELALSLTRLRHILSRIVVEGAASGTVPLSGSPISNRTFIRKIEIFRQFEDPFRRFLTASHLSRMPYQQRPNGVFWGESTKMNTEKRVISVYDKTLESGTCKRGKSYTPVVRFEIRYFCRERFATDLAAAVPHSIRGPLVSTISPEGLCALIDQVQSRLLGFQELPGREDFADLSTTSKLLILAAGDRLHTPHGVDEVLNEYRYHIDRCERTSKSVEKEVRNWVMKNGPNGQSTHRNPVSGRQSVAIHNYTVEQKFAGFLNSIQAPSSPDLDILAAWSKTRFLRSIPKDREQLGHVTPAPPPFPRRGLT